MIIAAALAVLTLIVLYPQSARAHCDTMDGPTAKDGQLALDNENLNLALKWIGPEGTEELRGIFDKSIKVRALGQDARELADQYFLESLVRIHRAGEGAPFEGLKPSGTPIDEKVAAADRSIETGDLKPLIELMEPERVPELEKRFANVMKHKEYDPNDVDAGRAYVHSYVHFFKFAEGHDHDHGDHPLLRPGGAHGHRQFGQ